MLAPWYLDEFCRDVYGVACVVDGLAPAESNVVFVPAVAGHSFVLFACVTEVCAMYFVSQPAMVQLSLQQVGGASTDH
jgi:hypothetical protein